jgi:hypothetical protein
MKKPNITPGKWSDDLWATGHSISGSGQTVARLSECNNAETNSRAIAALPELLAALEKCLALTAPKNRGALKSYESPEYQQVKAALTKAGYTF